MNRRGDTSVLALLVGAVVAAGLIWIIYSILTDQSDQTGKDLESLHTCGGGFGAIGERAYCFKDMGCKEPSFLRAEICCKNHQRSRGLTCLLIKKAERRQLKRA
jgi:hypothetical protein